MSDEAESEGSEELEQEDAPNEIIESGEETVKLQAEGKSDDEEEDKAEEDEDEKLKQEAEGEEEEEEKDPDLEVTLEMMPQALSLLTKTGDGLAHAYSRIDLVEKELTDISMLENYIHIRYIDLSKNFLKTLAPLSGLSHLLVLRADENKLTSLGLPTMPFLQQASFRSNRLKNTEGLNHPFLESLNLNGNIITKIVGLDASVLQRLHTLELRGNRLTSTDGLGLPNLKLLFLAGNMISSLEGLERMEQLTTLHLRANQIEKLDGFSANMVNLQYVNLRENLIADMKETRKLQCLPQLRAIVLTDNQVAEEEEYRLETLINLRRLERLDKEEFTEEERTEAEEIAEQRRQEELLNAENEEFLEQGEDQEQEKDEDAQ